MAVKLEKNHTTTLTAKKCRYCGEGRFYSEEKFIDFDELLSNFDNENEFDITIKETSKETVTNE